MFSYVLFVKGLIDPAAMARMALGEAVTNLLWAAATGLADVKASVNWMCALHFCQCLSPNSGLHLVGVHCFGLYIHKDTTSALSRLRTCYSCSFLLPQNQTYQVA